MHICVVLVRKIKSLSDFESENNDFSVVAFNILMVIFLIIIAFSEYDFIFPVHSI